VPADGFFEWAKVPGQRHKQPWYFTDPTGRPLAMAGLYETWRSPEVTGSGGTETAEVHSCTIITTDADDVVGPVHHRMPAVLDGAVLDAWLDPELEDVEQLLDLLGQCRRQSFVATPVGTAVNNVANNSPNVLEALVR
jgi:putative SOS response-associated peptidase YedK